MRPVHNEASYYMSHSFYLMCNIILGVRARGIHKYMLVLVPKNFMKFMFSIVYRVTQEDVVYSRKVQDLAGLRQHIIEAVELITPHMLINTWQELEYCLDICRATAGAHTEVYGCA
jgi:hypothetical protein